MVMMRMVVPYSPNENGSAVFACLNFCKTKSKRKHKKKKGNINDLDVDKKKHSAATDVDRVTAFNTTNCYSTDFSMDGMKGNGLDKIKESFPIFCNL